MNTAAAAAAAAGRGTHEVDLHDGVWLVPELVVDGVEVEEGPPSGAVEAKASIGGLGDGHLGWGMRGGDEGGR